MNALLFPGQGSQVVGMGKEFYDNFEIVKKIFRQADEKLNLPLSKIILEGPEEKLLLTKNTQPAILTVSYSIYRVLRDEFDFDTEFKYFAGHSLGEYSALVCAKSLNFPDAIYLLQHRGIAMQEAVPVGRGNMIAILGSKINLIKDLLSSLKNEGVCEIANDNAEGQVIISGDINKVNLLKTLLKNNNIKSIPLKVSAPFHCSLMKSAAENMREKINNTSFNKPTIKIVSNVTAEPVNDQNQIKDLLIKQIFSTVKWRESLLTMSKDGINNFIEIGPGKALVGMVKRTLKNSNSFSINSIADIKNLKNGIKK